MTRRPIVAGNWKMHKTVAEAQALVMEVRQKLSRVHDVDIVVAPPFTALWAVAKKLEDTSFGLAGQNCFHEASGAYTGEISPGMLREVGCGYCIVGHSERRTLFGATDAGVNNAVKALLREKLTPILCVGETLAERERGDTFKVVERQVRAGLAEIPPEDVCRCVLAYEPVWAIGTGRNATPEQAQEVHAFIRRQLKALAGEPGGDVRIQYGGSVKADNAGTLMAMPDVDGALVGGASLKADDFAAIVRAASKSS